MSEQNGPSTLVNVAMVLIIIAFSVWAVWWVFRPAIMWLSFYTSFYLFGVYEHLSWLMTEQELQSIVTSRKVIPSLKPTDYGIVALMHMFTQHGYVWRWIAVPAMLWMGWRTKQGVVRFKYNREIKDVYDLIEIQSKHFPASAIIKGKNLLATHPYVGPWATFALPLDFALEHKILWVSRKRLEQDEQPDEQKMLPLPAFKPEQKVQPFPVKRKWMPHYEYVAFSIPRAHELFRGQLGEHWQGPQKLPPLIKALYAAFLAQGNGRQDEAWEMIKQLAFTFKEGGYNKQGKLISHHTADTSGADKLIQQYGQHPEALAIIARHAHTINVMTATLEWARKKGRLMHANFLWLKPVDRILWYALCGQGGQCAYWEAAGPWAHMQVEKLLGKRQMVPMVMGAVEALRDLMAKEHWIEPGEYSEEHQRRMVAEANAKLQAEKDRREAEKQNRQRGGFSAPTSRQPPPTTRKRAEDDEP